MDKKVSDGLLLENLFVPSYKIQSIS